MGLGRIEIPTTILQNDNDGMTEGMNSNGKLGSLGVGVLGGLSQYTVRLYNSIVSYAPACITAWHDSMINTKANVAKVLETIPAYRLCRDRDRDLVSS